jgi:hypothetical protein
MIELTDKSIMSQPLTCQRFLQNCGPIASFARIAIMAFASLVLWPSSDASAQERPAIALESSLGWAGFVDNSTKHHGVLGAGARFYLTPRLAVGPEVVYMPGPNDNRVFILTGNLTFDFLRSGNTGPPPLNPYLVAGGGLFQHRDELRRGTFTSNEAAFTVGGGLRVFLNDRVYIAPEVRVGWELHLRTTVAIGFRF